MPTLQSAQDMLALELKSIQSAEQQLSRSLPKLAKKIASDRLRSMLDERLERGGTLLDEVEQALDEMEGAKGRTRNTAAEGLIRQADEEMRSVGSDVLRDPLLLASVQKIEHYCIAAWGTAAAMGRLMNQKEVVRSMERAVKDGRRFDEQLNQLAERELNPRMLEENAGEDEEEGSASGERGQRGRRRTSQKSRAKSRSSRSRGRSRTK
jgi:ferritin-like metal-binding protein YciE